MPSVNVGPSSEMTWTAAMPTNEYRHSCMFQNALHSPGEFQISLMGIVVIQIHFEFHF